MSHEIPPLDDGPVSKTRRKKQMHELQDFGESLLEAPASLLARLPLDERTAQAIADWKKIRSWEARRRHSQYLGRLLREGNGEEVRAAFDALADPSRLQRVERLRDRLLADDDAVHSFISEHAGIDAQHLRQLVRNARREREDLARAQEAGTPGTPSPRSPNYQKLFQWLRQTLAL